MPLAQNLADLKACKILRRPSRYNRRLARTELLFPGAIAYWLQAFGPKPQNLKASNQLHQELEARYEPTCGCIGLGRFLIAVALWLIT